MVLPLRHVPKPCLERCQANQDGYKQRLRQFWQQRAPTYDKGNSFHPPLCEQLVALASLSAAARVLDVATGTGTVAFAAARVLGSTASITAVDISEPMLAQVRLRRIRKCLTWLDCEKVDGWLPTLQAREKAREAGLTNMDLLCQDIETATFSSQSFDHILCSNGMAYLQRPAATLQLFHSWLSPGGSLCFNNPLVNLTCLSQCPCLRTSHVARQACIEATWPGAWHPVAQLLHPLTKLRLSVVRCQ